MVDITEISAIVAAAGVLIGVVYYVMEMRHQTKIRQTDLVIRLSSFVDNKEIAEALMTLVSSDFKDVDELREKISPPTLIIIANFYHRVGVLVQKGLVDADLVGSIIYTKGVWENIEPWIVYVRQKLGIPHMFGSFEDLYNEMKKREQTGVKNG
jgi:hypothetical protein